MPPHSNQSPCAVLQHLLGSKLQRRLVAETRMAGTFGKTWKSIVFLNNPAGRRPMRPLDLETAWPKTFKIVGNLSIFL